MIREELAGQDATVRVDLRPDQVCVDIAIAGGVYTVWDEEDWPWIKGKIAGAALG
jgi:hypothetical protein